MSQNDYLKSRICEESLNKSKKWQQDRDDLKRTNSACEPRPASGLTLRRTHFCLNLDKSSRKARRSGLVDRRPSTQGTLRIPNSLSPLSSPIRPGPTS
jgi:hypothetical protein